MAVKRVMVLSGVRNAGKTNTLNRLAEKLSASHRLLWVGNADPTQSIAKSQNVHMPTSGAWRDRDHWYCFEVVQSNVKKCVVAISTKGDERSNCSAALGSLSTCVFCPDVIVLASRSHWSGSVEAIENWASPNIIPSYTAIMVKPNTKQKLAVENAIVDRLYNELV